jgi:Cof subfamily protein (haloacid dehalogenase superfamily)
MSKRQIKLVAVDMDGTLVNDRKEIPKSFAPWVIDHPEVQMVIASGRPYYTNERLFRDISDKLIIVGDNGSLIFHKGNVLYKRPIPREDVLSALSLLRQVPEAFVILCGVHGALHTETDNDPSVRYQLDNFFYKRTQVDDLRKAVDQDEILKLSIYFRNHDAEAFYPQIAEHQGNLQAILAGDEWIDLVPGDVSKGDAIRIIEEMRGIRPSETMAFGDYLNDYTMLQTVGESYAMENGHPELKKVARHIAPNNNEEGVMQVLRHVFDGKAYAS